MSATKKWTNILTDTARCRVACLRLKKEKNKKEENKAGYTAIQPRTVGQEQLCENRSGFKKVTGPTDRQTD